LDETYVAALMTIYRMEAVQAIPRQGNNCIMIKPIGYNIPNEVDA